MFLCTIWFLFGCQYQHNRLLGKTLKLYSLTHYLLDQGENAFMSCLLISLSVNKISQNVVDGCISGTCG